MIKTETELFNTLLLIALALISARLLGYVFDRFRQPAVIGELIAGIILGGLVVVFFSDIKYYIIGQEIPFPEMDFASPEFSFFAGIGILFLLFISGLETSLDKLKQVEKSASFVAIGGVIVPFVFGVAGGLLIGFDIQTSTVIGLILIATSVGVTVRTLMDLHVLHTDIGATILGGAVIDDIIGIVLLAFVLGIQTLFDAVLIGIRIAIFFLIFLILGLRVIDKILNLGEKIHLPKALLSISLAILLIYSFFADKAGISGIIGAFIAGILIGHTLKSRKIIDDVQALGYGFFIPLFFVSVGASLWLNKTGWDLASIGLLTVILVIIGILGKILGCGIGAYISGMNRKKSLQVGVGMIPRMELALIIASSAVSRHLLADDIAHQILAATILLTVITTLIAPFLIKAAFKK